MGSEKHSPLANSRPRSQTLMSVLYTGCLHRVGKKIPAGEAG